MTRNELIERIVQLPEGITEIMSVTMPEHDTDALEVKVVLEGRVRTVLVSKAQP